MRSLSRTSSGCWTDASALNEKPHVKAVFIGRSHGQAGSWAWRRIANLNERAGRVHGALRRGGGAALRHLSRYIDLQDYLAHGFSTSFSDGTIAVLNIHGGSVSGASNGHVEHVLMALNFNRTIDSAGVAQDAPDANSSVSRGIRAPDTIRLWQE